MSVALNVALSSHIRYQKHLEVVTNNLANMGSVGFQADMAIDAPFNTKGDKPSPTVSYVADFATIRDLRQGKAQPTNNPLHLMIKGPGYFAYQTPKGIAYSRAGALLQDNQGQLVDAQGNPLLNAGNGPITLPLNPGSIQISTDGTLSVQGNIIDRVGVFNLANEYDVQRDEGTYLYTKGAAIPSETYHVTQGVLEGSNVDPIKATVDLVQIQRLYMANQRAIDQELERQRGAVNSLLSFAAAA
jgi:flagellar basal-body rod protein FlgF